MLRCCGQTRNMFHRFDQFIQQNDLLIIIKCNLRFVGNTTAFVQQTAKCARARASRGLHTTKSFNNNKLFTINSMICQQESARKRARASAPNRKNWRANPNGECFERKSQIIESLLWNGLCFGSLFSVLIWLSFRFSQQTHWAQIEIIDKFSCVRASTSKPENY